MIESLLQENLSILVLIGATVLLALMKPFLEKVQQEVKHWAESRDIPAFVANINALNSELAIMRDRTSASRAQVYKFHNGDYYLSGAPIMKMSCVAENVKPGREQYCKSSRSINIETVPEAVSFLSNLNENPPHINAITVDELDVGFFRALMESTGVTHILQYPLFMGSNIVGLLVLHYESKPPASASKYLVDNVSRIEYNTNNKGLNSRRSLWSRILG